LFFIAYIRTIINQQNLIMQYLFSLILIIKSYNAKLEVFGNPKHFHLMYDIH